MFSFFFWTENDNNFSVKMKVKCRMNEREKKEEGVREREKYAWHIESKYKYENIKIYGIALKGLLSNRRQIFRARKNKRNEGVAFWVKKSSKASSFFLSCWWSCNSHCYFKMFSIFIFLYFCKSRNWVCCIFFLSL